MNIFFLDYDTKKCAQYHNNKHLVKMILESSQLLSNAWWMTTPYNVCQYMYIQGRITRFTHIQHPCSIWTVSCIHNWLWLRSLVYALEEERHFRQNCKVHKSFQLVHDMPIPNLPNYSHMTTPVLAMPDRYKSYDVISSYRMYYIHEKSHLADWGNRGIPYWWSCN